MSLLRVSIHEIKYTPEFFTCKSTTQIKAVEHSHHCTQPFHTSTQPMPVLWHHLCGCPCQFFPSVHCYVSITRHTTTYPFFHRWTLGSLPVLAIMDKVDLYSPFSGVGESVHAPGEESCWAREWVCQLLSYCTISWVPTHFADLCFMASGWGLCTPCSCSATWLPVRFCSQRLLEGGHKAEGGREKCPFLSASPWQGFSLTASFSPPWHLLESNFQISQHLQKQVYCIPCLRHQH